MSVVINIGHYKNADEGDKYDIEKHIFQKRIGQEFAAFKTVNRQITEKTDHAARRADGRHIGKKDQTQNAAADCRKQKNHRQMGAVGKRFDELSENEKRVRIKREMQNSAVNRGGG